MCAQGDVRPDKAHRREREDDLGGASGEVAIPQRQHRIRFGRGRLSADPSPAKKRADYRGAVPAVAAPATPALGRSSSAACRSGSAVGRRQPGVTVPMGLASQAGRGTRSRCRRTLLRPSQPWPSGPDDSIWIHRACRCPWHPVSGQASAAGVVRGVAADVRLRAGCVAVRAHRGRSASCWRSAASWRCHRWFQQASDPRHDLVACRRRRRRRRRRRCAASWPPGGCRRHAGRRHAGRRHAGRRHAGRRHAGLRRPPRVARRPWYLAAPVPFPERSSAWHDPLGPSWT
ncbi:hypothetical protein SAMN05660976_04920 [Nonomuraea pusilla]|uniref:Uncharacterized protein n=1 Tax=Nonomuraea pusilla TaxID=46177 RepID=A0A1H7XRX6_9ACTN|nr:hypothetical protein SAMN05660976_04920 [Nonomuraea pusilla]